MKRHHQIHLFATVTLLLVTLFSTAHATRQNRVRACESYCQVAVDRVETECLESGQAAMDCTGNRRERTASCRVTQCAQYAVPNGTILQSLAQTFVDQRFNSETSLFAVKTRHQWSQQTLVSSSRWCVRPHPI